MSEGSYSFQALGGLVRRVTNPKKKKHQEEMQVVRHMRKDDHAKQKLDKSCQMNVT